MRQPKVLWLFTVGAAFAALVAAQGNPSWKTKPPSQWDANDAKEILTDSPWTRSVELQQVAEQSPGARRESGDWDANIGPGVGIAGTGILGPLREHEALEHAHEKPDLGIVVIRWVSANPVRAAQAILAGSVSRAEDKDYYAIEVADLPVPKHWHPRELRGIAALRRNGKKDFRPSKVEVHRLGDDHLTIVYLFPRSTELTKSDRRIEFEAQIGELFVAQFFYPEQMQIGGQIEL